MIKGISLYKSYTLNKEKTIAVNNVSLDINDGDYIAVVGESGSGKTTLISMLGLLLSPDKGEVYYNKYKISKITDRVVSRLRKNTGFIFQNTEMINHLNIIENIMLPSLFLKLTEDQYDEMFEYAIKLLKILNIENKYRSFPKELSGGQAQRACILRSLIHKPDIILADEPTGELDSETNKTIIKLFQKLNEYGTTIFLVTHFTELSKRAKTILTMEKGEIVNVKM